MFRKITIITVALFILLMSSPTSAATDNTSQIPQLNPFCWHRIDCHNARKQFLTNPPSCAGDPSCKELEQGFITAGVDPCTGGTGADQWGRCLPAGTSKTEISFGGESKFSNIGEFIVLMYKYLVTIASIVAVVVIIVAGAQWITSGGNSEAIGSAKKRIGGAIIGLFIAYMSYFVLNTINPALVNLRLPQVWLIKPQALMTEFCADLPNPNGELKFAKVAGSEEPNKPLPPSDQRVYQLWDIQSCGSRFLAENGGEQTCVGGACGIKDGVQQTCFDKEGTGKGYDCDSISIAGRIIDSSFLKGCVTQTATWGEGWESPEIVDNRAENELWIFCKDGTASELDLARNSTKVVGDHENYFLLVNKSSLAGAVQKCIDKGTHEDFVSGKYLRGFAIKFEMNEECDPTDEDHYIGVNGVDLGDNGGFFSASEADLKDLIKNGNLKARNIKRQFFIPLEKLLNGFVMNIDAANIHDIDEDTDRDVYKNLFE